MSSATRSETAASAAPGSDRPDRPDRSIEPHASLDVAALRADFPILARRIGDAALCYLDNAATTQKPRQVLAAMQEFYEQSYGSVARGVHQLSAEATSRYEAARARVARFLGAGSPEEIVFVRGTTEAANLVAWSFARQRLAPGDEILVTELENGKAVRSSMSTASRRCSRRITTPRSSSTAKSSSRRTRSTRS